jgi:ribosomal 50S subunit-recycling heat shock protein
LALFVWQWPEPVRVLVMVGFLGGYTTFSAFSLDVLTLGGAGAARNGGRLCLRFGHGITYCCLFRGRTGKSTVMSEVQIRKVGRDEGELRLDRWFRRHFPELTQVQLQKLLRSGQVRVDGKRAKASDRIEPGMSIRIPPHAQGRPAQGAAAQTRSQGFRGAGAGICCPASSTATPTC